MEFQQRSPGEDVCTEFGVKKQDNDIFRLVVLRNGVQCCVSIVTRVRLSGCWFKSGQRHCVVSLSKTLYPLLSSGSTQETCKIGVAGTIPGFTSLLYDT